MRVYYHPLYVASDAEIDTTRKSRWIYESLIERPIDGVEIVVPRALTRAELLSVHTEAYVAAVETGYPQPLAESNYLPWNRHLLPSVCSSNGGVKNALNAALTDGVAGSLSSGLHHAYAHEGKGFCTFNGIAIAVKQLVRQHRGLRVLILDLDAHGGGGTYSIVKDLPTVTHIDMSTSKMDAPGCVGRHQYHRIQHAENYLPCLEQVLNTIKPDMFDVCLYNAGMDIYEYPQGIDEDIVYRREQMVFSHLADVQLRCAFVLAGGYVEDSFPQSLLVDFHRSTIAGAAGLAAKFTVN